MADRSIKSPIQDVRVPPQNIEAEKALLGSVMLRPEVMHDVMEIINPGCFYVEKHRLIFTTMFELFSKSNPIDLLSISSRLEEREILDQVGGSSYLTEIVNGVPSAANAKHYAELIQKKFMMRNLISAANQINQMGYNEAEEVEELLDKAEKQIFEVTNLMNATSYVSLGDELGEAFERLERLSKSDQEIRGVHTGFKALDDKLSGLQPSDLIILAARPSMGKTSLALDIARQSATMHGSSVCIFSLEMSSQQLVDRMLSAESQVDAWKLRVGGIKGEDDFTALRDALGRLSSAPIYIDDQPGSNILKMRSVARRIKRDKGLDLIVVDYLQLMLPSGRFKNAESMVQQITEISRSLKILAREMDVPVLALSQLSRAVESRGGKPRLSDLRDSGSIEQDADVVMFIHNEWRQKEDSDRPNISEILIEKHRNGPVGMIELYFDEARASFKNLAQGDFASSRTGDLDDF